MRTHTKVWIGLAAFLTLVQIAASALLPRGMALTAVSDFAGALTLLALVIAFAQNAFPAQGRLRLFWILQAIGWSISLINQLWWITYDMILKKPLPTIFAGDVLLFLPGLLTLAGFLLRPHIEQSRHIARLGTLRFLLLMTWWIFFYVFLVSCWQYVSPNEALYNRNYDALYLTEMVVLSGVLVILILQTAGAWRRFYLLCLCVGTFNYLWFALENRAIEQSRYFNGCWYDCPYLASFAGFMFVATQGRAMRMNRETAGEDLYGEWMSVLAILAVLSLPVMVVIAVLEHGLSVEIMHFRVLVTALAMFASATIVLVKQRLLHRELRRANLVLEESSTTDPLTGIRNRRFFSATIQRDVAQAIRTHLEGGELSERDLIFYLIDLDNFKKVNDDYGHDSGDRVLIEAARRIGSAIRNSDLLVRWGGEEFLVVSRFTDRRQAAILAERVLDAFRSRPFSIGAGQTVQQTCSIGWAAYPWIESDVDTMSHEAVLKFADRGLYRAKKAGKNQAVGMAPENGVGTVAGFGSLFDAALRFSQSAHEQDEFTEIST